MVPSLYGGFHKWGYPNSWMAYFLEKSNKIRMMTGGTPTDGNHHKKVLLHDFMDIDFMANHSTSWRNQP